MELRTSARYFTSISPCYPPDEVTDATASNPKLTMTGAYITLRSANTRILPFISYSSALPLTVAFLLFVPQHLVGAWF